MNPTPNQLAALRANSVLKHPALDAIYQHLATAATVQDLLDLTEFCGAESPYNQAQQQALLNSSRLLTEAALEKLASFDALCCQNAN